MGAARPARRAARALALAAAALSAACAAPAPRQAPPEARAAAPRAPEDAVWLLAAIDGRPARAATRAVFADGAVNAQGPCNAIRGRYRREGAAFHVVGLAVTRATCPDQDEENRLLDGLLSARSAEVRDGRLVIRASAGPTLTFEAARPGQ
ncbi:META domain-containing protein [Oceanicella actignis]|uniref:META domain-containing protein n=1 Tax=Oceanicella actignis TaxID=1189325 RepID=UPI0011E690DE|nr:META domain-containing protein [Oceanicella actignis]TYO88596.1 heat shock protein HslJ [Oceanicella actignis]